MGLLESPPPIDHLPFQGNPFADPVVPSPNGKDTEKSKDPREVVIESTGNPDVSAEMHNVERLRGTDDYHEVPSGILIRLPLEGARVSYSGPELARPVVEEGYALITGPTYKDGRVLRFDHDPAMPDLEAEEYIQSETARMLVLKAPSVVFVDIGGTVTTYVVGREMIEENESEKARLTAERQVAGERAAAEQESFDRLNAERMRFETERLDACTKVEGEFGKAIAGIRDIQERLASARDESRDVRWKTAVDLLNDRLRTTVEKETADQKEELVKRLAQSTPENLADNRAVALALAESARQMVAARDGGLPSPHEESAQYVLSYMRRYIQDNPLPA